MNIETIIIAVISSMTTIVVAYIELSRGKKDKNNKELAETKAKLAAKEAAEEEARLKGLEERVKFLEDFVEYTKKVSPDYEKLVENANVRVEDLVKMNNISLEYCASLSKLINVIGDGIENGNNTDSKMVKSAVKEHEEWKNKMITDVCKVVF